MMLKIIKSKETNQIVVVTGFKRNKYTFGFHKIFGNS
jgi:hypothetical protein